MEILENDSGGLYPRRKREREKGEGANISQRDVFRRYRGRRERGEGGGPLARALGSALNGHKWQTNTAVGSASTKVETSRARPYRPTFHGPCSPSTFLPRPPHPPVDFSPDCRCRGVGTNIRNLFGISKTLELLPRRQCVIKILCVPLWLEFT